MYVDEAIASGIQGDVRLEGFLIGRTGGPTRLCTEVLESFPPQCGGPSVLVEGLDAATVGELSVSDEIFWSEEQIELSGVLEDGVLRVSGGPG